ncbi:MAG: glycerophosphodiester phosphodiesterase [Actinomycetota bacterium]|nr:glycerophosphodiester phosphodiesterase [Actinomycetota bacterium]
MILGVPFLDAPPPVAFAHRGYAPDGSENSMVAFERAVKLGYRYLETDVRATADGVALAFHDATLDRVTGQHGRIGELSWAQVRGARIGGREPIPVLADLLSAWPHTRINLDVKSESSIRPTLDAIARTGSIDRVCVGSFSGARVATMRRFLGEQLCTALAPRDAFALRVAASRGRLVASRGRPAVSRGRPAAAAPFPRHVCAQVPYRIGRVKFVDRRFVELAHRLQLPVHVWTVNDRSEMTRLLDLGVDGIMTDAAEVLRGVLIERGQWHATVGGA